MSTSTLIIDSSADTCRTVDTQYTDGIEGALIVHPRSYPQGFPTWDEDLVVELTDVYHLFSTNISSQYLSVCGSAPRVVAIDTHSV